MFRGWLGRGKDEQGFTLVELLMVMVIIGVLAGIGFAGMGMLQKRTLSTKADTYWRVLDSAVTMQAIAEESRTTKVVQPGMDIEALSEFMELDVTEADSSVNPPIQASVKWDDIETFNAYGAGSTCIEPKDGAEEGIHYCIGGRDLVSLWFSDGKRVGPASNNPKD